MSDQQTETTLLALVSAVKLISRELAASIVRTSRESAFKAAASGSTSMNLKSIIAQYSAPDKAREFFEAQRWPDGTV
jgi:hypothetical protein